MGGRVLFKDFDVVLYAAAGNPQIDAPKLGHFAVGTFYKAAVHSWRKGSTVAHMSMDVHAVDALRKHLLERIELPTWIALSVTVDTLPVPLEMAVLPYQAEDSQGLKRYLFYLPGVLFQLFVGDEAGEKCKACFGPHPEHPVWMENVSISMRNTGRLQLKDARRTQKLDATAKELDERGLSIRLGD